MLVSGISAWMEASARDGSMACTLRIWQCGVGREGKDLKVLTHLSSQCLNSAWLSTETLNTFPETEKADIHMLLLIFPKPHSFCINLIFFKISSLVNMS